MATAFRPLLITAMVLCTLPLVAQQFIEGYYNPTYRSFMARANAEAGSNVYDIDNFEDGVAFVTRRGVPQSTGLMDTTGRILIPMNYARLEPMSGRTSRYYLFHQAGKMGVITRSGDERLVLDNNLPPAPKHIEDIQDPERRDDELSAYKNYITLAGQHYARVKSLNRCGLFDLNKKEYVIPVEYDCLPRYEWPCDLCDDGRNDIRVEGDYAVVRKNRQLIVFDLQSGQRSEPYTGIESLSNGTWYITHPAGNKMVCGDPVQPTHVFSNQVEECFNQHLIISSQGKLGLCDASGNVVIPLLYDDVHFINNDLVWLKKEDRWAISTYDHSLKSDFEFLNADQTNARYLEGFLYFTHLDTAAQYLNSQSYVSFSDRSNEIKSFARYLISVQGTRKQFTTYGPLLRPPSYSFVTREDGDHVIYLALLDIEEPAWTRVYIIPSQVDGVNTIFGYQLNGRYGYEPKKIRYDGILYDTKELSMLVSRGCLINKGCIECEVINYNIGGKPSYWKKLWKDATTYIIR